MARHRRRPRPILTHALLALSALLSWAMADGGQTPTDKPLRSAINLVTLDAFVTDGEGRPIADLRPDEVALRVDGRLRPIASLQLVATDASGASVTDTPSPPFGTNVSGARGRAVVLVVDDDSIRPGKERPLREAVDAMLAALGPRDRVALVTMPYGGTKADLTTRHDEVRTALALVTGQAPQFETGSELACRTRRTLESLTGLLKGFAGIDEPIFVLFFSSALSAPRRDAPVSLAPGMCELTAAHFQSVSAAAISARAHLHVIQPDDVMVRPGVSRVENIAGSGFTGSDNPLEGLEHLAGVTGGQRLYLGESGRTLTRIARETTAYYLMAFEPESSQRNGLPHRVELRVTRPEALVRVAPAVMIERVSRQSPSARDMLRQVTVFRDLPVRGAGFVSREAGDRRLKVIVFAELVQAGAAFASGSAGLFDQGGKLVAQWTAEAGQLGAATFMGAILAAPGEYRLRVAGTDTSGRGGSADAVIAVGLAKAGALELSGLVLGVSRPGGFRPTLQFGVEPVATAYLEIFGGTGGQPVSVRVEMARTENGPALVNVPAAIAAGADRHIATAAVPIGAVPPGDYVIRAIVSAEGQPSGRVMRTLRKIGL